MKKRMLINTLYIQIDDTPIPNEVKHCCFSLDCRQINNFCSFMGDALLGDMKDSDGTPFYRIVSPAGKLISEFEQVDDNSFRCIIKEWYKLLMHLLHQDVSQASVLNFTFPENFSNWLLSSTNEYISKVGENLLNHNNVVEFSQKDIFEEIIIDKISKNISEELTKKHYEFIAFSSSDVNSGSIVEEVLSIKYNQTHFITFGQLKNMGILLNERNLKLRSNLTWDNFLSRYGDYTLNGLIESAFRNMMKRLDCLQKSNTYVDFWLWKREKIESIFENENFRKDFYESEKLFVSYISIKVQEFREENEFKMYNDYEDRICKSLETAFCPRKQDFFMAYYYPPMNIDTVIEQFVKVFIEFNERNKIYNLAMHQMDFHLHFNSNSIENNLKNRLLFVYECYCLNLLKDSLQNIWVHYTHEDL